MRDFRRRGNMMVFVVLIALVLGGALVWLLMKKDGPGPVSAEGIHTLAQAVPKETGLFVAADFRDVIDPKQAIADYRKFLADLPPEGRAGAVAAEAELGITAEEIAEWAKPVGFLAFFPLEGNTSLVPPTSEAEAQGVQAEGKYTACQSNLKNIGTACEMYSTDYSGRYPLSLGTLTPNYLRTVPSCPAAEQDTYSSSYQSAAQPDLYTFFCSGHHHEGVGVEANFPQYNGMVGLEAPYVDGASSDRPEKPFEIVSALAVSDMEAARTAVDGVVKKLELPQSQEDTIGGSVFHVYGTGDEEWAYGFHGGYLLLTSGTSAAKRVVECLEGKSPRLADDPGFQSAVKQVKVTRGALGYFPVKSALAGVLDLPDVAEGVDDQTRAGVASLDYMVGAADAKTMSAEIFMKVDPQAQSDFAKALLTQSDMPVATAQFVPADSYSYSAVNLQYVWNFMMETARLIPEARPQVAMVPAGLAMATGVDLERDIWPATTGEFSYLVELPENLDAPSPARGQGQYTACKSNLKNLGTAMEMYSTDYSGLYPQTLALLTPNYLRTIPTCPAVGVDTYSQGFESAAKPDLYTLMCTGNSHEAVGVPADYPVYTALAGLDAPPAGPGPAAATPTGPTWGVFVGVKDKVKIEEVLTRLQPKLGKADTTDIEGHEVQSYAGGLCYLVLTEKPSPVLVLTGGEQGEKMMGRILAAAGDRGKSLAGNKLVEQGLKKAGGKGLIVFNYLSIGPIAEYYSSMMTKELDPEGAAALGKLKEWIGTDSLESVSYVSVEKDGLRYRSLGGGSSGLFVGVAAIGAAVVIPNFVRARGQGQLTACKSNLKNLGTACEMYSTDSRGRYPHTLSTLTPNYLKTIPTCPTAGDDTYTESYRFNDDPDLYTFFCSGHHHQKVGTRADHPMYNSMTGLEE